MRKKAWQGACLLAALLGFIGFLAIVAGEWLDTAGRRNLREPDVAGTPGSEGF